MRPVQEPTDIVQFGHIDCHAVSTDANLDTYQMLQEQLVVDQQRMLRCDPPCYCPGASVEDVPKAASDHRECDVKDYMLQDEHSPQRMAQRCNIRSRHKAMSATMKGRAEPWKKQSSSMRKVRYKKDMLGKR